MLFLVTDTSGKNGFVGLVRADDSEPAWVIEEVPLAGGTFSAQLVPQISGLLAKHGLSKADIGAFVVVSGPGSFTGLRVGLAAIKALAEILQKPIVPVSLLEVIAFGGGKQGRVIAALDAGRGDVYLGEYEVEGESARLIQEQILPKAEFLESTRGKPIVTPDKAITEATMISAIDWPHALEVASVGLRHLRGGDVVSPEQLEANYIRRSDAEIFSKPAAGS
jgi:tRNA threonylcarbamoyladenosine biosynthesis protein TsaB